MNVSCWEEANVYFQPWSCYIARKQSKKRQIQTQTQRKHLFSSESVFTCAFTVQFNLVITSNDHLWWKTKMSSRTNVSYFWVKHTTQAVIWVLFLVFPVHREPTQSLKNQNLVMKPRSPLEQDWDMCVSLLSCWCWGKAYGLYQGVRVDSFFYSCCYY